MPDLRSNWLPFYRPYSFASQPFDCFAENIQFRRSCIAVQPPFVRLPDCFLFYHVRLHSSRFCGRVFPFLQIFFIPPGCCCFVPARFLPPRPFCPKNIRLDVVCVKDREKRKFLEISSVSRRKHPHSRRNVLRFTPPRAILSLASNLCFLVPPIHVVVRVGRDGGAPPCPVPIYYRIYVIGGILNGLLSQTRHARPGACSDVFRQEKGISPSPRCRTTDRSPRSRLCHDDRHDLSCFCRYV